MLKTKLMPVILFIMFAKQGETALPPLYQSLVEYKALLNSEELIKQLDAAEAIVEIKNDQNFFVVKTRNKTLKVERIFDPMEHPGPQKFHFDFHSSKN